jgi:hypothetical protein
MNKTYASRHLLNVGGLASAILLAVSGLQGATPVAAQVAPATTVLVDDHGADFGLDRSANEPRPDDVFANGLDDRQDNQLELNDDRVAGEAVQIEQDDRLADQAQVEVEVEVEVHHDQGDVQDNRGGAVQIGDDRGRDVDQGNHGTPGADDGARHLNDDNRATSTSNSGSGQSPAAATSNGSGSNDRSNTSSGSSRVTTVTSSQTSGSTSHSSSSSSSSGSHGGSSSGGGSHDGGGHH